MKLIDLAYNKKEELIKEDNNFLLIKKGMKIEFNKIYEEINDVNKISVVDKKIKEELINCMMKKGKKRVALRNVNLSFLIIRKYFNIDPLLLLRLIISKSGSIFSLQKYVMGRREKIIPRFIFLKRSVRYILRMLVKHAKNNVKNYRKMYLSFANTVIEYCISENKLIKENQEKNELARLNKYFLFSNKKKKRKMKIFKKVNNWK